MTAPPSAAELLALSETDITVRLTSKQLSSVLSQAPFVHVEGTFNVRDLGKLPASAGHATATTIRPDFVFRSGMLTHLTDQGKAKLANNLGVRRVFDFRSQSEHTKTPDPKLSDSVTMVWQETAEATPHISLEPFAKGFGEAGFAAMYLDVLKAYRPTIKLLLEHVRDRPQEPFLFHCTAGRDRTGVIAGLLHTLAGAPADTVALDYVLSRVGTEPVRDELEAFARKHASVPVREPDDSPEGVAAAVAATPPGFMNVINLRIICWDAFLKALEEQYGGYEGYVQKELGFTVSDVSKIRKNLTKAP
ncbi:hypothetical protein SEPCBS119000_002761 [Sporothrix epigloea]|uniref:Tyrosine specific protein phosphatases domain-containing protein n=1 Tax=Sporothrix epigloea TaxID=1892477 RepID=A0ABP0DJN2_9PEZI